jgi:hypothetical protein
MVLVFQDNPSFAVFLQLVTSMSYKNKWILLFHSYMEWPCCLERSSAKDEGRWDHRLRWHITEGECASALSRTLYSLQGIVEVLSSPD